ncbi:MAG TPA: ATP-binding protein [Candidatus Dormibacteraeota bacterium]|jgi:PAS domain S-box-containing protein|nr:ATP-binding protein [Candidatus Dormibacteraeota bacterium]
MVYMRVTLPLLRIPPARAPILRYGVAVLSTTLALIPAVLLPNITESRLAVFAVAVMVSAWYGGWKPGLVATSFALTVSAYFSFSGEHTPAQFRSTMLRLALFVVLAALICWFNAALRAAQEGLRRSEVNFRSLVTNAPYGICRCDSSGQLLDANPALRAMLGYTAAEELLGKHLGALYADSQQWFELADHLRSAAPFNGLIVEWKRTDGTNVLVRVSGRSVSNGDRDKTFELFAEDVTERRALEQQLRQSQKMEAVGRLAGGIAHDFNNLLMVISGYSEFLLDRLGPEPALRAPAQEIANAAGRATSLTRQLLAFSRKQMLAPKILDLNGVVTENLKMLTRVIGEDIDLVMVPAAGLGTVRADAGQIEQVIMNLAVNARDAMPAGGKLTIETSNVTLDEEQARFHPPLTPGNYVLLAISDTGAGMDSETQSRIFEPFFTTKGVKGTGLGLSTVYGIVKQSGGYIWVYSEQGKGTTFKIYLPRVADAVERPVKIPVPSESVAIEPGTETILLVEDEANLRYLARQFLEKQGYRVIDAADGAVAMQIAVAHEGVIHLLLTDVIMPGMNGRELAQHILEIRPNVKVLYMSGYTENVIGRNGTLDAGVRLLQKPFTLRDLKSKVREVLDSTPFPPEIAMSVHTAHAKAEQQLPLSRAQRFQLHLPLKYRRLDEEKWHDGETRNISRSGLLFQAEDLLQPNVILEINLVLPSEIAGLSPTEVVCRGEVVRTVGSNGEQMPPALAAKILQYHFQHGSQLPRA